MEKDKRFEVKFTQGVLRGFQVIVDKNTGVNYLFATSSEGCGLTVLVDAEGKPIVTP